MKKQTIKTNRDLYRFIAELCERYRNTSIALIDYLSNLRMLARGRADQSRLDPQVFGQMLAAAFSASECGERPLASSDFTHFDEVIASQIRDLAEMREAGTLDNEYRYFGIDAPSGARWYNFDPCGYLECATAGTFDGWDPSVKNTGRALVPGKVLVETDQGPMAIEAADLPNPFFDLDEIDWETFAEFLRMGQSYE